MEQSIIYVQSSAGKPLMPTRRRNKVWYWLRRGLAEVVRQEPLTIRLRFETAEYTQPVTVGVDTGSKTVGVAATTQAEVLYQAEVYLRTDITDKMTQRRTFRRSRRSRKTRYRAPRWANRRRKAGWLVPSVFSKLVATLKAVRFVVSLLPVCRVNVELASFDTQKMRDPEITGSAYQHGTLFGYQMREYLLEKWQRSCAYCGARATALQVEHIVPKARGGSDRLDNLVLACAACNQRKGSRTAAEFGHPQIQAQARQPLRDAAHVSSCKTALLAQLQQHFGASQVRVRYGYQTKYQRIQVMGLPKSHAHDAVAIACTIGEVVKLQGPVYYHRCLPRGSYRLYNGKHSQHKVWAPRRVRGWKLHELVEARGQIGYIGGRRVKGSFVLKDLATSKPILEVTPRKLRRLARPVHGWIIHREGRASSPD